MAIVRHLSMLGVLCVGLMVPCVLCGPLEESVPGVPGADYPVLSSPPQTSFSCTGKSDGGYYADREARCQAFHICSAAGREEDNMAIFSFVCPNGTLFNQQYFVCDWWFNVDCDRTEEFYDLNEELDRARQSSQSSYGNDQDRNFGSDFKKLSDVQTSPGSLVGRGSGLRAQAGQDPLSLQSLYQAPGGRQGDSLSPYKRPSRDLQFNYVNTAKKEGEKFDVMKEEPSAQEILETLVRLVSPEDLEDLYIR